MAIAVNKFTSHPVPSRLTGALAAATVVVKNTHPHERVYVLGASAVTFRYKAASVTGTLTANIHPCLADAIADDTVGTRAVTGLPTAVTDDPTTERTITYTLKGEQYVDFELSLSNGGSDTCTLSYVDVFWLPI